MSTLLSSRQKKIALPILLLFTISTALAVGNVYLSENTVIKFKTEENADVRLEIVEDISSTEVIIRQQSITIDGITLSISSTNNLNMTVSKFKKEVVRGQSSINMTATADAGNINFTLTGLIPDSYYRIMHEGQILQDGFTDENGKFWFNNSQWSTEAFRLVRDFPPALSISTDPVRLTIGSTVSRVLRVHNNDNVAHTYTLSADPSNTQGVVNVDFRGLDVEGSTAQFEVAGGEDKKIDVLFQAALCYSTCSETVTLILVNEDTGARFTREVPVEIIQEQEGVRAPGLMLPQLAVLLALASLAVLKLEL